MKQLAEKLIAALNAFDGEAALTLFAPEAVIDDVSVGEQFTGTAGVRAYLEQYFVAYHTVSKLLSVTPRGDRRAAVQLDFTGDFGHETGVLDLTTDAQGLIVTVDANLD